MELELEPEPKPDPELELDPEPKLEPELREVRPGHWAACWKAPGYDSAPRTTPNAGLSGPAGQPGG